MSYKVNYKKVAWELFKINGREQTDGMFNCDFHGQLWDLCLRRKGNFSPCTKNAARALGSRGSVFFCMQRTMNKLCFQGPTLLEGRKLSLWLLRGKECWLSWRNWSPWDWEGDKMLQILMRAEARDCADVQHPGGGAAGDRVTLGIFRQEDAVLRLIMISIPPRLLVPGGYTHVLVSFTLKQNTFLDSYFPVPADMVWRYGHPNLMSYCNL